MEEKSKMVLGKKNYIFIIVGCLVVLLGFILMSGGGSENPDIFNEEELFSFRRITLAPFMVMVGYGLVLFGIMKKQQQFVLDYLTALILGIVQGLTEFLNTEVMKNYNSFIVGLAMKYASDSNTAIDFGAGIGTLSLIFREKFIMKIVFISS